MEGLKDSEMSVGMSDKEKNAAPDFKKIQEKVSLKEKLLKPQIKATKPLDLVFEEVNEFLQAPSPLKTDVIEYMYGREESKEDVSSYQKRKLVITKALRYLHKIQLISNEEKLHAKNKELITISLPDMKIFGELLNFIILQGFYPLFPKGVGIPLERRKLNNFTKDTVKTVRIQDSAQAEDLLYFLVTEMLKVFLNGGDVKLLLMRGSGYSDMLTGAVSLLCNPSSTERERNRQLFVEVESFSSTYELFGIYTLLLQPYSQPWLRLFSSKRLSSITYERQDGVMSLIEFIVGMREDEEINIEKIDHVSRILISKPQSVDSVQYFSKIGSQLYEILVFINRPLLTSIALHIVESIFERNQNIVRDFVFDKISLRWCPGVEAGVEILTSEKELNNSFNVILSLTRKLSPELLELLLLPTLFSRLWSYLLFLKTRKRDIGPVTDVFTSFFTITKNESALDALSKNLLEIDGDHWQFGVGENGLVEIRAKTAAVSESTSQEDFFQILDVGIELFIGVLKNIADDMLALEFSTILKRWLKVSDSKIEQLTGDDSSNPYILLVDLKLLEAIVQNFKDVLSRSPDDMLTVVKTVLASHERELNQSSSSSNSIETQFSRIVKVEESQSDVDSDDEDEEQEESEFLKVVLELLSAILSETSTEKLMPSSVEIMKLILPPLRRIGKQNKAAESLYQRISKLLQGGSVLSEEETEEQIDKNTLTQAITSLNDPLVPIRAHGLFLLRQLISKKSKVISLEFVVELHLVQLKDPEPYIYLNSIKGLDALISYDREEVLPLLLEIYGADGGDKKYTLDERLRIGEVLLRFITNCNDTLSGEISRSVTSKTLSIIRIPSDISKKQDNTLRMSAMSLLGMCCRTNPVGILDQLADCFDCVLGILQLETSKEELILRRSAIVLVHDLISGPGGLESVPQSYGKRCVTTLQYLVETDNDLLARDQLRDVLNYITESIRSFFTPQTDPSLDKFKVI